MISDFFSLISKHPRYRQYYLMKNVTPNQLSLMMAGVLFFLELIVTTVTNFILGSPLLFSTIFIFISINTALVYGLFYFALERFIYRRIKLIYKRISRLKSPVHSLADKVDMNRNMIEEVEAEVVQWSKENKAQIRKLQDLEVYRREFLGDVSHELKTPIFNLQGYLHTLVDGGLEDPNINRKYLEKAAKNADRLNAIVEDLEIITRLEAGELILNWQEFKIYDLAREVMDALEMMARRNKVSLTFKDGCNTSAIVRADRERVRQVLTNLLTNSIRYSEEDGKTFVGIYDMDKHILLEVTDNGIGIAADHLPRLFERFYRVDKNRTRAKGGSGLGLAIVKHIVEAHKQSINVRSKENVGTTFGFTLARAVH